MGAHFRVSAAVSGRTFRLLSVGHAEAGVVASVAAWADAALAARATFPVALRFLTGDRMSTPHPQIHKKVAA